MAYPTVPHQWFERYKMLPATNRQGWFTHLADSRGILDSPRDWSDRVLAWSEGLILVVGRPSPTNPPTPPEWTMKTSRAVEVERLPSPDRAALIVMTPGSGAWVYSHRAVWSAAQALQSFGVGHVFGAPDSIAWWNGLPFWDADREFVPAPSRFGQCVAFSDMARVMYWHPSLLGPVWIDEPNGNYWAPDLEGAWGEGADLRVRGETVPMGRWTGMEIIPVSCPGGWWRGA